MAVQYSLFPSSDIIHFSRICDWFIKILMAIFHIKRVFFCLWGIIRLWLDQHVSFSSLHFDRECVAYETRIPLSQRPTAFNYTGQQKNKFSKMH